jgi:hypothetical protein
MAKKSKQQDLADRLHVSGIRRKVADSVAKGVAAARPGRKAPKGVNRVIAELKSITTELEDRAKGGPARRKAAAKKAAATRKRNAAKRRQAAKKAARTRAKSRS